MAQSDNESGTTPKTVKTWNLWRVYTIRLVLFSVVVAFLERFSAKGFALFTEMLHLWPGLVLGDATVGLLWGLMFTPTQNIFNTPRVPWKSLVFLIATFLVAKFFFIGVIFTGWKIYTRM